MENTIRVRTQARLRDMPAIHQPWNRSHTQSPDAVFSLCDNRNQAPNIGICRHLPFDSARRQ